MNDSMPPAPPASEAQSGAYATAEPEVAGPSALGVPRVPTGHAGVDAQIERLGDVDRLGTEGHLGVYEDVHRGLRDALSALDAHRGPAPGPGAAPGTSGPARPLADHRP
ncbi:hypothetical protein ACGFW5_12970 [Streptomyces sp. NPDC048416]|uniref:hypothetical protein n=1 Tax=Streptomyces sp. NPDC048416 TaxID=3365546 RepID=UPI00371CECF4